MFKFKPGIKVDYNRQGYIYFTSRCYRQLTSERQTGIKALCITAGGEHWRALFDFVTTDETATAICMRCYISQMILYRAVKRYYEEFPALL